MEREVITLNKLVKLIGAEVGVSQETVKQCMKAFCKIVSQTVDQGGSVSLSDFGRFDTVPVKERYVVVPGHDEPVCIKAHKKFRFTASKTGLNYYVKY